MLHDDFEALRGIPIRLRDLSKTAPFIETSDAERLCRHPLVSVLMITYNHEAYIGKAIEGVMAQQTDFEFELVIGEDCSPDKTRDICFEYQKKFPDKIRVLWWHENVRKLGGNLRRVESCCRGELWAHCEGDDEWTDPLKLQKQVDVMRANPSVELCFAASRIFYEKNGTERVWNQDGDVPIGKMSGREFFFRYAFGKYPDRLHKGDEQFVMTATTMYRAATYKRVLQDMEIYHWALAIGDVRLWSSLATQGDVYCLPDIVARYNQLLTGATNRNPVSNYRDVSLTRTYFFLQETGRPISDLPVHFQDEFRDRLTDALLLKKPRDQRRYIRGVLRRPVVRPLYTCFRAWPLTAVLLFGALTPFTRRMLRAFHRRTFAKHVPKPALWLLQEYGDKK